MQISSVGFSDCTRHLYVSKLNMVNKIASCGMRRWLFESEHYVVIGSGENSVEICYYDENEVLSVWANDISRLSCAFLESVVNVTESSITSKFMAWNLVQYYYSAFYSAHSILKILGFGLIQLDGSIINKLKKKALAMGISFSSSICKGMYCVDFDTKNNKLILYKINRYDDSHKGLWKRFFEVLCILNGEYIVTGSYGNDCVRLKNVYEGTPGSLFGKVEKNDALDAQNRIEQLKGIMNLNGDQNWLSYVRNLINYNHALGSWYPYVNISTNYQKIIGFRTLCFENFLDNQFVIKVGDDEITKFVKTCQLINAMNYDLLMDLNMRNPEGKSFIKDYVLKYLNLCDR